MGDVKRGGKMIKEWRKGMGLDAKTMKVRRRKTRMRFREFRRLGEVQGDGERCREAESSESLGDVQGGFQK